MYAIVQHELGPPEVLRYEEVPDPVPGDGQVRIAVEAAGVHFIDTRIRQGFSSGPLGAVELPMTPGREVAGRVGGRRVVAHLGPASGGYAELAVAPADALHEIPDRLSAEAAVAMIGTGRTAMGILDRAALGAEDVVLVTAAAGGLGTLFVQAARNAGAVVAGVAGGAAKAERVRSLGADVAVDHEPPGWPERVREGLGERAPTVVLDGVGGELGRAAFDLLGPGGRLLLFGMASGTADPGHHARSGGPRLAVTWALDRRGDQRALETPRSPKPRPAASSRTSSASRSPRPPRRTPRSRPGGPRARSCCFPRRLRNRPPALRRRGWCPAGPGSAPRGPPRGAR